MRILIIEHRVCTYSMYSVPLSPVMWHESRLIDNQGNYLKIGRGITQADAFQDICPKDKRGKIIPTHIIGGGMQSRYLSKPRTYNPLINISSVCSN